MNSLQRDRRIRRRIDAVAKDVGLLVRSFKNVQDTVLSLPTGGLAHEVAQGLAACCRMIAAAPSSASRSTWQHASCIMACARAVVKSLSRAGCSAGPCEETQQAHRVVVAVALLQACVVPELARMVYRLAPKHTDAHAQRHGSRDSCLCCSPTAPAWSRLVTLGPHTSLGAPVTTLVRMIEPATSAGSASVNLPQALTRPHSVSVSLAMCYLLDQLLHVVLGLYTWLDGQAVVGELDARTPTHAPAPSASSCASSAATDVMQPLQRLSHAPVVGPEAARQPQAALLQLSQQLLGDSGKGAAGDTMCPPPLTLLQFYVAACGRSLVPGAASRGPQPGDAWYWGLDPGRAGVARWEVVMTYTRLTCMLAMQLRPHVPPDVHACVCTHIMQGWRVLLLTNQANSAALIHLHHAALSGEVHPHTAPVLGTVASCLSAAAWCVRAGLLGGETHSSCSVPGTSSKGSSPQGAGRQGDLSNKPSAAASQVVSAAAGAIYAMHACSVVQQASTLHGHGQAHAAAGAGAATEAGAIPLDVQRCAQAALHSSLHLLTRLLLKGLQLSSQLKGAFKGCLQALVDVASGRHLPAPGPGKSSSGTGPAAQMSHPSPRACALFVLMRMEHTCAGDAQTSAAIDDGSVAQQLAPSLQPEQLGALVQAALDVAADAMPRAAQDATHVSLSASSGLSLHVAATGNALSAAAALAAGWSMLGQLCESQPQALRQEQGGGTPAQGVASLYSLAQRLASTTSSALSLTVGPDIASAAPPGLPATSTTTALQASAQGRRSAEWAAAFAAFEVEAAMRTGLAACAVLRRAS